MQKSLLAFFLAVVIALSQFPLHGLAKPAKSSAQLRVAADTARTTLLTSDTNYVRHFLKTKLMVESIADFDLTARLEERFKKLDIDVKNPDHVSRIFRDFFSEHSADTIARAFRGFARPDYPNTLIIGKSGSGKSHLLDQFALIYSFGLIPEYLKQKLQLIDDDSPAQIVAKAFYGKTNLVFINDYLISHEISKPGNTAYASAEDRANATLKGLFSAAKKEFLREDREGRRTIFVLDEAKEMKEKVHKSLKAIMDEGGFDPRRGEGSLRKEDPGFHVLAMCTDDELRQMIKGDPAIERRYLILSHPEPTDEQVFPIIRQAADDLAYRSIEVDDDSLRYLISMKNFLDWPPQAAPGSVKAALADMVEWKIQHPGKDPFKIDIKDTQKFLMGRARLTNIWFEGPNGEPAFHDLEARLLKRVVGQDAIVKDIAKSLQTWARTGFGQYIPVFIIAGPTGAGKDTLLEAINRELFGISGKELMFNLGGVTGHALDAILTGPPLGNHNDQKAGRLEAALTRTQGVGVIGFNEAYDTRTEELERLKVLVEQGVILPSGEDSRPRPLRFPIFIMGQFNEGFFDGANKEEILKRYKSLTLADIEKMLMAGKPGTNGEVGALTLPLINRAKRYGGIYMMAPVDPTLYPKVIDSFLPSIKSEIEIPNAASLVIEDSVKDIASEAATRLSEGTRGLNGITRDFITRAISSAIDRGLVLQKSNLNISATWRDGHAYIIVRDNKLNKDYSFLAHQLIRGQNKCESMWD